MHRFMMIVFAFGFVAFANASLSAQASDAEIIAFVKATYSHGVPYDAALALGPASTKTLLKLLQDPAYWNPYPTGQNIAVVLGILGQKAAVKPLKARLEEGSGTLSADAYRNKSSVLMALGYHLYLSKDPNIRKYLTDGTTPSFWNKIHWLAPWHPTSSERNNALAELATLALALSGDTNVSNLFSTSAALKEKGVRIEVIQEAQAIYQEVKAKGLSGYYRDKK